MTVACAAKAEFEPRRSNCDFGFTVSQIGAEQCIDFLARPGKKISLILAANPATCRHTCTLIFCSILYKCVKMTLFQILFRAYRFQDIYEKIIQYFLLFFGRFRFIA